MPSVPLPVLRKPAPVVAALVLCGACFVPLAPALAEPVPVAPEAREAQLQEASSLQARAREQQGAADRQLADEQQACYGKFLVNACLAEARKRHVAASHEAQRLENRGKSLEREIRLLERDEREQARVTQAQQRTEMLQDRAAEKAAAEDAFSERRQQQLDDKARRAEEGERRHAEAAARVARKQAEREARLKEKAEAAERRQKPQP